jgi:O-antigen/teichoic acid export membrane protein
MAKTPLDLAQTVRKFLPMALQYAGSSGSLLAASLAQLVTFAVLARYLGTEQFALLVIISAFANVGLQVCGLGTQEALIRRVARQRSLYPEMMGHSLILTFGSGAILVGIGIVAAPFALPGFDRSPGGFVGILLLLVTNIVLMRFISLVTSSYIAISNFRVANGVEFALAAARTIAAVLACLVFKVHTVEHWAYWAFTAHAVIAAAGAVLLVRLGTPKYTIVRDEIRIGVLFSTQFVFKAVRQNTDLLVLSMVAGAEAVASYGVARRLLDSSFLSVEALNRLIYPGSAVVLEGGFHRASNRVRKVMSAAAAISGLAALAMFVFAPLIAFVFGHQYVSLVSFTRAMCWLAVPMAVTSVSMEVFGAAGRQGIRAMITNTANLIAAGLVGFTTLQLGVTGAFLSSYGVEIATAAVAISVLVHFIRQDRRRYGVGAESPVV